MTGQNDFDLMSDRCIEAGDAVMKHGSPDMQAAMRVLLAVLGREIATRITTPAMVKKRRYGNALAH